MEGSRVREFFGGGDKFYGGGERLNDDEHDVDDVTMHIVK